MKEKTIFLSVNLSFIVILTVLIIVCLNISCKSVGSKDNSEKDNEEETDSAIIGTEALWLQTNSVNIRSVDADDCDFSDLLPLKESIGNAKIVLLGEQTHGDGTTFQAKVRLIKFLHQEMGFDVVAFESGFYDCQKMWLDILDGVNGVLAAKRGIFGCWAFCSQVQPLFEYIADEAHGASPLEVAGVDCQFTGIYSPSYLVEDLENFLSNKKPSLMGNEGWTTFRNVLNKLIMSERYVPDEETQNAFYAYLNTLLAEVNTTDDHSSPMLQFPGFWRQLLVNIRVQAEKEWYQGDKTDMAYVNLRDAQMADNLLWLHHNSYKDRKIIVWAATFHIIRNPEEIDLLDPEYNFEGMRSMGHVLWENLGQVIYSIGFTAYEGKFYSISSGRVLDVEPAPAGSLDYFMKQAGFQYGFIDFRNLAKDGEWLKGFLISRPLGNENTSANWTRILDGMVFISELEPSAWH